MFIKIILWWILTQMNAPTWCFVLLVYCFVITGCKIIGKIYKLGKDNA